VEISYVNSIGFSTSVSTKASQLLEEEARPVPMHVRRIGGRGAG
jgi:hypothetical protein